MARARIFTSRSAFGARSSAILAAAMPALVAGLDSRAEAQCGGMWTQPQPAVAPTARGYHAMVFDEGRGVAVVFGGLFEMTEKNDTWEWNGTNWAQKSPAVAPTARAIHAMAYDSARAYTVLFGGVDGNVYNAETWEWDGTNWFQRTPAVAPSARVFHAMAYDSARGVTVLFGGFNTGVRYGDTWVWTGTNWSQKSPVASPSPRAAAVMAYDENRGVTVLFGGLGDPNPSSETWEWDGSNWSQKFPAAAPSARAVHSMAFDSARGVVVLFGGAAADNTKYADTWEWDGTNWSQRSPAASPSARVVHAMAYDSARDVTWLFGGQSNIFDNETWQWRVPRVRITQQPASATVIEGQAAMFSITAAADAPTYAWRRNGAALVDGGTISGAAAAMLTINPTSASDAGDYDCEVSIGCDTKTSQTATLVVTAQDMGCGACGAGVTMMMPLSLIGLVATARYRRMARCRKARWSRP